MSTATGTSPGGTLIPQNDGNLVIYNVLGAPVWDTNAGCANC